VIEKDYAPYDIAAALTKDGKAVTFSVVNPTTSPIEVRPALAGATFAGNGTRYHISGKDEFAHNFPGQPRAVDIVQTDGINPAAPLAVPALSATVFVLPLK
jgi:alpha-N-arabinofuranosidase